VAKTANATRGRALVLKVDTEKHPELAARYGVRSIPNFVVFRDGEVVGQHAGLVDAGVMQRWLEDAAA
jgi:thioredoxin 2